MIKKFKVQKLNGEGAIRFISDVPDDIGSFDVRIVTIGYYSEEDEVFFDVLASNLVVKTRLVRDTLFYSFNGIMSIEVPDSSLGGFLAEDFLDVSCDFFLNGNYLDEDEDIEIVEAAPWVKINLI
jgi:hypothetical protein